jgi:hypothetical protein
MFELKGLMEVEGDDYRGVKRRRGLDQGWRLICLPGDDDTSLWGCFSGRQCLGNAFIDLADRLSQGSGSSITNLDMMVKSPRK